MNVKVILVLMENVWMGLGLILACVTLPTQGLLVMKIWTVAVANLAKMVVHATMW
jgi:hypothetical protein